MSEFEFGIGFATGCMTILGYIIWVTYTAYGLSAFPIGLIKGRRHIAEEESSIQEDLELTRQKQRQISSKYLGGKKISKRDKQNLSLLRRQERVLTQQSSRIRESNSTLNKIITLLKPFGFLFGFLFLAISLLVMLSIIITQVDAILNSQCGSKCGFILQTPGLLNPLDQFLVILAKYFPLDYVILSFLVLYIFYCTLTGIKRIGVRFLWVNLYSIRPHRTVPQALLMTALYLMFAILSLNMEIVTLAPSYASFGSQKYVAENGTLEQCSMDAPLDNCTMTQVASFINSVSLSQPFFSSVFYYASWLFVGTYIIGLIVALVKRKRSNIGGVDEYDSDEEAFDKNNL